MKGLPQSDTICPQVIWLNWGLTEEDVLSMPAAVSRGFSRSLVDPDHRPLRLGFGADLGPGLGRTLMAGEWNSALYAPLAAAASSLDKHLPKNRMSGLWNEQTPLWRYLAQSGHKTLLFAGVNTDQWYVADSSKIAQAQAQAQPPSTKNAPLSARRCHVVTSLQWR
jgi:hypothetical protein